MFNEEYLDLKINISDSAMRELIKHEKTLYDVVKILEEGYEAPRKRKKGTIEKWYDKGNKTFNVVIIKSYNVIMHRECWVLVHFGRFTRRKNEMS